MGINYPDRFLTLLLLTLHKEMGASYNWEYQRHPYVGEQLAQQKEMDAIIQSRLESPFCQDSIQGCQP